MQSISFITLTRMVQEYISQNFSHALSEKENLPQLKSYIDKYLHNMPYSVEGYSNEELSEKIYMEMAEYSFLTPYLSREDIEEININAWNDIAITYSNGKIEKCPERFSSPTHAVDIVKRLLHHSGMIIDNASPMSMGHLPNNSRITALKNPIVDEDVGVSVSIRILHPARVDLDEIITSGMANKQIVDFLLLCLKNGISFVIAGATSSGKTTLLNALLSSIEDDKRIFSIESGARELSLVRKDENDVITNNVVHTISRPSDNPSYDISQEDLVVSSLRFNPDVVVVGEMRDTEAYSAVEASLTGHTVLSTIHSYASDAAHMRLALLCQKRFPIDFSTSLLQASQAFPIVVYTHKLGNNKRKIMDISECEITSDGERKYRTLFRYKIGKNEMKKGEHIVTGRFEMVNPISDKLKERLIQFGATEKQLEKYVASIPESYSSNGGK